MAEEDRPEGDSQTVGGKVPVSAYIMAVISGIFVTFGFMFAVAFSHMFLGDWLTTAPKIVLAIIPFVALGLGALTIWQTIRQAKQKALGKSK